SRPLAPHRQCTNDLVPMKQWNDQKCSIASADDDIKYRRRSLIQQVGNLNGGALARRLCNDSVVGTNGLITDRGNHRLVRGMVCRKPEFLALVIEYVNCTALSC